MGYDLHKYERFHTFNVVPAGATSELAVAVNKAGHIVQASEVRAEAVPYCGLQGSLDAIKSAYATYPIGTLASVRNSDNLYQKTAEGVWTQIAIPAKGGFTPITANGQAVSDTNPAILRWHYQVPLTYLNATNNGQDSNRFSAKYLGVEGVSDAINQFVSSTDNIYNNAVSSGYDVKVTKAGKAMNKGESEANDQWMDSPYSGMILFMKQQATGSDIRMTCFEYVGKTVQEQLNNIKVESSGGIKGIIKGTGITVDSTTEGGLKPTVSVDTSVIATKQHVKDSIDALDSTQNGGSGVSVVQTNGVVATTVTPATVGADGSITANTGNVVTATGAKSIADKAAADKIATELTATTGSIAQAIETAKNAAINNAKVTVKTSTTSEAITELTLTDTSTSSDDVKISITPQTNTASDGKINLKVSASTSTLAKKADTISAEGKNTTVATGTAPEVKVVLGGTVSAPTLTVTATDVASASTLAALAATVNEHIAAKGGALTLQLADSLQAIEKPSTEVIYLIPAADSKDSNIKDEYIYVNGEFEKIGSTAVSLAGYATEAFVTGITDTKADKSTTYTKTEVDTALGGKADKTTTYTKTEVDTALGKKANSADVYTKSEVNTELGKKADATAVYTKTESDEKYALLSNTYTKGEMDTALAGKATTAQVQTAQTTADNALAGLAGKADKTAVVSSFNGEVGDVQLATNYGLSLSKTNGTITVAESKFGISGTEFSTFTSDAQVVITTNTLQTVRGTGERFDTFINTQKLAEISRDTCTCEIIAMNVDLPACVELNGVSIYPKVSCPNLVRAAAVKLVSVEAMLYLVDSLQTLSTHVDSDQAFVMVSAEAQKDITLFNELNAELKAKGWVKGVTVL